MGTPEDLRIVAYSDATYASLEDGSYQGVLIVFIQGKDNMIVSIIWQSKKLYKVTKSPLASETLALGEAADAGLLVSLLLQEIYGLAVFPSVNCFTDNDSLVSTLKTANLVSDRSLRIEMSRLGQMV